MDPDTLWSSTIREIEQTIESLWSIVWTLVLWVAVGALAATSDEISLERRGRRLTLSLGPSPPPPPPPPPPSIRLPGS